jgi:hypothetical protein
LEPPKKLVCSVSVSLKNIPNLPQALQARLGKDIFFLTKEEKISMLRDGAKSILEHTYTEIRDQIIKK